MHRVGVVSDTHGKLDPALLRHFSTCDEIWHAGDIGEQRLLSELKTCAPVRAVYGNIDGDEVRQACPRDERFTCEELDVWITHITGRPGHYDRRVLAELREAPPDILVGGHSHVLQVRRDRSFQGMVFLNPGAAGYHGPHRVRTALIIQIRQREITRVQAIELGLRSVIG